MSEVKLETLIGKTEEQAKTYNFESRNWNSQLSFEEGIQEF